MNHHAPPMEYLLAPGGWFCRLVVAAIIVHGLYRCVG